MILLYLYKIQLYYEIGVEVMTIWWERSVKNYKSKQKRNKYFFFNCKKVP